MARPHPEAQRCARVEVGRWTLEARGAPQQLGPPVPPAPARAGQDGPQGPGPDDGTMEVRRIRRRDDRLASKRMRPTLVGPRPAVASHNVTWVWRQTRTVEKLASVLGSKELAQCLRGNAGNLFREEMAEIQRMATHFI